MITELKQNIENAWEDRALLNEEKTQANIRETIELLDKGKIRVAEKADS